MQKYEELIQHQIINHIYEESKKNNIPILRPQTVELLCNIISQFNINSCLEIGTAFGFSTAVMSIYKNIKITTIEKDYNRYTKAKALLKEINTVQCLNVDCFEFKTDEIYDLVLLDGPKSNQDKLIEKFIKNLSPSGIIFIDNLYLKKFTENKNPTKNQLKILNSLNELKKYIQNLKDFKCTIYDIEDGVAVLERI